jgi:hypothetical protein
MNEARHDGPVRRAWSAFPDVYCLVDDFVGMGGTLANFRGYLLSEGAAVLGAIALTAKPHSTILSLKEETREALERKHADALEPWWRDTFGFGFDCLTESEAHYLLGHDARAIRTHLAEAGLP